MVCVVAFFVVLVLSVVSAKYRKLLGRAWGCMWRRVTFRPCDSTFRDDVKSSMLAPLALKHPKLVKPASIAIEVTAWVMVLSLVVSVYLLGRSGLNLFVYGTCDKQNAQSCSLAAEMCSVDSGTPGFWESIGSGDILGAFGNEFAGVADTISAIPSRLKSWDAAEFATADATYAGGYVEGQPIALEVLDPGCEFCARLFRNILESGLEQTHNVTYLVYPISADIGYKFPNSPLVAQYLTAVRAFEASNAPSSTETADWYILRQLFTGENADGTDWQVWMNTASSADAEAQLQAWLGEFGYTADEIAQLDALADSDDVAATLAATRVVVEDDINTVAIPTLIAGGRLMAGLQSVETLQGLP